MSKIHQVVDNIFIHSMVWEITFLSLILFVFLLDLNFSQKNLSVEGLQVYSFKLWNWRDMIFSASLLCFVVPNNFLPLLLTYVARTRARVFDTGVWI